MQKPRVNVHVTEETWERLNKAADRPDISKASIVDAALAAFLSPEADDRRDAAIVKRLDKISRQLAKLEEQNLVLSETLALLMKYTFYFAPIIPDGELDATKALAKKRYEVFLDALGKQLAKGPGFPDIAMNTKH